MTVSYSPLRRGEGACRAVRASRGRWPTLFPFPPSSRTSWWHSLSKSTTSSSGSSSARVRPERPHHPMVLPRARWQLSEDVCDERDLPALREGGGAVHAARRPMTEVDKVCLRPVEERDLEMLGAFDTVPALSEPFEW